MVVFPLIILLAVPFEFFLIEQARFWDEYIDLQDSILVYYIE